MSRLLTLPRFAALIDGIEMTPDLITGIVTAALLQAEAVANELYDTVIPELPPAQRAFPSMMREQDRPSRHLRRQLRPGSQGAHRAARRAGQKPHARLLPCR
ncbi:MAG: hypothetical protein ACEPO2_13595 [Pelagibaca sp.]